MQQLRRTVHHRVGILQKVYFVANHQPEPVTQRARDLSNHDFICLSQLLGGQHTALGLSILLIRITLFLINAPSSPPPILGLLVWTSLGLSVHELVRPYAGQSMD